MSTKIDASLTEVGKKIAYDHDNDGGRAVTLEALAVIREDLTAEAKLLVENPRRGERSLRR